MTAGEPTRRGSAAVGALPGHARGVQAVCVLRPLTVSRHRDVWGWLAAALVLRALGFVLYLGFIRTLDPQPYPSIADLCWLLSALAMLIALARLARASFTGVSLAVLLDGVVGGLAIAKGRSAPGPRSARCRSSRRA